MEIEPRIPLKEAAALFFPHGGVSESSLRTEAKHGRLEIERVAGKDFVTETAIKEMLRKCRVDQKARASTSAKGAGDRPSGASATEPPKSAVDATRERVKKRKASLRNTSKTNTGPNRLALVTSRS